MSQYKAALADFNRALELAPNSAGIIASRGVTYGQMDQYQAALNDFNRALELEPDHAWAIGGRGEAYRLLGQHEAALEDLNRTIEQNPDNDWSFYQRALVYQTLGQPDNVEDDANAAIQRARQKYEKDPQDWQNTFNLALYYLAAGATSEAEQLYRETPGKALPHRIRIAIDDLDDFLAVFQEHAHARSMRELLQRALEPANDEQAPAGDEQAS